MLYAREGATVVVVDVDLPAALDTVTEIESSGGNAIALNVDVTDEGAVEELVRRCHADFGSIDILHNNVGASLSLGDGPVTEITSDAFDRVIAVNLKSMILTAKHAVPLMREQRRGVIINISSFAAYGNYPNIAYKTAKAGVIALTQNLAITNAEFNIRANSVVPGLINTPMAVESRIGRLGSSREEVIARRDEQVPLGHKMGSAWDVAYASLFLASDEARFITGVALPVDGGQSLKIG
jgi:NAD(P)-dependent dehydrogenase (short-subunit alcohol dehydrogenase family)